MVGIVVQFLTKVGAGISAEIVSMVGVVAPPGVDT